MIAVFVIVSGVIGFICWCESKLTDAHDRLRRECAAENERLQKCAQVIRSIADDIGYLFRIAFTSDEIDVLIHAALDSHDLWVRIHERCASIEGVVIGKRSGATGAEPVLFPSALRTRHLYLIGETGSGKTTFLVNLMDQDLAAGNSFIFLTPEADTVHDVVGRVPRRRIGDVVLLDPANDCTIPLNPFHAPGQDIDLVTDETTEAFRQLFANTDAAPRTEAILRATVHALLHVPGGTLLDAGRLLDRKDASFRRSVAAMLPDEHARHFWEEIYPAYPKDAHLPIVTRFARLIGPRAIRSMLCAPGPSFDFGAVMNNSGVMLCALSDGRLGPGTARLLGQLVITRVQLAAMRRAELPPSARRLSSLIIDEFAEFTAASASFERLLSRSRKYGLALVAAHQQTAQLPERTLKAILGNVGTIVSFRVSASDARILARELTVNDDKMSATAFASLGVGDAIVRIDRTTFRMRTIRPSARENADVWVRVRERSLMRAPARDAGNMDRGHFPLKRPLDDIDPANPFGGKA